MISEPHIAGMAGVMRASPIPGIPPGIASRPTPYCFPYGHSSGIPNHPIGNAMNMA
jgi:hypothetical protein